MIYVVLSLLFGFILGGCCVGCIVYDRVNRKYWDLMIEDNKKFQRIIDDLTNK